MKKNFRGSPPTTHKEKDQTMTNFYGCLDHKPPKVYTKYTNHCYKVSRVSETKLFLVTLSEVNKGGQNTLPYNWFGIADL
jgi:hypothetical protein